MFILAKEVFFISLYCMLFRNTQEKWSNIMVRGINNILMHDEGQRVVFIHSSSKGGYSFLTFHYFHYINIKWLTNMTNVLL